MRLYDYLPSGNGYKVRLLLRKLERPFELVELDIKTGAARTEAFRRLNPNGKIPTVELDDGRSLSESHAILQFFGEGSRFIPSDAYERAQMWQWMCFEQYSLEPFIGTLRYWRSSLGQTPEEIGHERYREKQEGGHRALAILDAHLRDREWICAEAESLADIALYAYTHVAEEGDFTLADYPALRAWQARFAQAPGHVRIDERTTPASR